MTTTTPSTETKTVTIENRDMKLERLTDVYQEIRVQDACTVGLVGYYETPYDVCQVSLRICHDFRALLSHMLNSEWCNSEFFTPLYEQMRALASELYLELSDIYEENGDDEANARYDTLARVATHSTSFILGHTRFQTSTLRMATTAYVDKLKERLSADEANQDILWALGVGYKCKEIAQKISDIHTKAADEWVANGFPNNNPED